MQRVALVAMQQRPVQRLQLVLTQMMELTNTLITTTVDVTRKTALISTQSSRLSRNLYLLDVVHCADCHNHQNTIAPLCADFTAPRPSRPHQIPSMLMVMFLSPQQKSFSTTQRHFHTKVARQNLQTTSRSPASRLRPRTLG